MAGGIPLDRTTPAVLAFDNTAIEAYSLCLTLESLEAWPLNAHAIPPGGSATSAVHVDTRMVPKICARLLARMMTEAPTDEGRVHVAREIRSCKSGTYLPGQPLDTDTMQRLAGLAAFYQDFFLRVCELLSAS